MQERGYGALSFEQRVRLLSYLCAEVLETDDIRDVLEGDDEEHKKLIKTFEDEEKALSDKRNASLKEQRKLERDKTEATRAKDNEAKQKARAEKAEERAKELVKFNAWRVSNKKVEITEDNPKYGLFPNNR